MIQENEMSISAIRDPQFFPFVNRACQRISPSLFRPSTRVQPRCADLYTDNVFFWPCLCPTHRLTVNELYASSLEVRQTQENFTVHTY